MTNLYRVLGVCPTASAEELKSAYRALAKQHHPDRNCGQDARFKELSAAYEVLSDSAARAAYDRTRAAWADSRGAVLCRGCGNAVRIPTAQNAGAARARCPHCKTSVAGSVPPAGTAQDGLGADALAQSPVLHALAERLRVHGQRIGSQMLIETAEAAEQLSDEVLTGVASLAVEGVRTGFNKLRDRMGLNRSPRVKVADGSSSRTARTGLRKNTALDRRKE